MDTIGMGIITLDERTTLILSPTAAESDVALATWAVAPEDRERYDRWLKTQFDWLNALERRSGGKNTRRAYERDVLDFFGMYANVRLMPWHVTPAHAETWVQALRYRELSAATINRKVAALSSLYRYASQEAVYVNGDGSRAALWPWPNPFGSRSLRTKVSPYGHATYPSSEQVTALLAQIDVTTITGLRNLAILHGMFATTRRVSEWINLRGRDIHEDSTGGHWFEYRYKGGETKRQAIPPATWQIITAYLRADGRLGQDGRLRPEDYVFLATSCAGSRLKTRNGADQVRPGYDPARQPIGPSYVNQLIRRYGRAANIPDEKLHAHALRHAGARWRKEHGADIWQLKDTLGHASIAITQIYSDTALDEPADPLADTIGAVLPKQLKFLLREDSPTRSAGLAPARTR